MSRKWLKAGLLATSLVAAGAIAVAMWGCSLVMPGDSYRGALPLVTPAELTLAERLRKDVEALAGGTPKRNAFCPEQYQRAEDHIALRLARMGYVVNWQTFEVDRPAKGDVAAGRVPCSNVWVELRGAAKPEEVMVVGAHYDAVYGSPGANDNASGTAATLALAQMFAGKVSERTIRFVFFANEEPPFFWTDGMGSLVYARECKRRDDNIVAMLSLETMGFFVDEPGSQNYPPPLSAAYPSTGNFIAFVGMIESESLVKRSVEAFRKNCDFPSEGAALSSLVPRVVSSDHWSFWKQGYPSLMVTDTAMYRYPHYHKPTDTPEKLDYERMARVVVGLKSVVEDLARGERSK